MTKFVIDAGVAIRLASDAIDVAPGHTLLAPTLLRSETLSMLHVAVSEGKIGADAALGHHRRISAMPIRLLGDAVLRRRAWQVADELGWADTYTAEYVALTLLQGDAFITEDADVARQLDGVVRIASIEDLRTIREA